MKLICGRRLVLVLSTAVFAALAGCAGWIDRQARSEFLRSLGQTSITVFPAFIREGPRGSYDERAAAEIAAFLKGERLADASAAIGQVPIDQPWHRNQARMLRESAQAFSAYLRAHPTGTQYALMAEYLTGGKRRVVGIHCYVVKANGTPAAAFLLNSHHKAFSRAKLKEPADCTAVVIQVLRDTLKPAGRAR